MWRLTLLTAVCLCFVLAGSYVKATASGTPPATSSTKITTATPKPSTATNKPVPAVVSSSTKAIPTATQKSGSPGAITPKPTVPATTQPQIHDCKEFSCVGETCYTNASKAQCRDKFCVITASKNGSQIKLVGSCEQTCTDEFTTSKNTHCCTTQDCNIDGKEVTKAMQFSGAAFWTLNLLFLFIMQVMAFVLNA